MFMTQRGYATHRGVSRRAVQKAIESGRIRTESDGTIHAVQADADWTRNTRASATSPRRAVQQASGTGGQAEQPETQGVPDYHKAHAIRVMYEAKLAKLEVGVRVEMLDSLSALDSSTCTATTPIDPASAVRCRKILSAAQTMA